MNRVKVAELTSGVGALVLGIGLGALFPRWFGSTAWLITLAGLLLHAFGMWDEHRLERTAQRGVDRWVTALYWTCWLLLAGVFVLVILRAAAPRA